jgi:hypothetical protein
MKLQSFSFFSLFFFFSFRLMGQDWLAALYIISFLRVCGVVDGNWQGLGRVCSIKFSHDTSIGPSGRQDGCMSLQIPYSFAILSNTYR